MEEKIIILIARVLGVPKSEIELDTEIGELPEWDSLRNVEVIAQLEQEFNVKITSDMIMDLEDVSDIVDLIESLIDWYDSECRAKHLALGFIAAR